MATKVISIKKLIEWVKSLKINHRLKLLLRSLVDYYGTDAECFPSVRRLCDEIGVSRATLHRWLNQLETLGLIHRIARFRPNGGKTSNLYRLLIHGYVSPVRQQEKPLKTNVKHAPDEREDVVCKDRVRKSYTIDVDSMKKLDHCIKHYNFAIKHRWLEDSSRNQLAWFSSWAKVCRMFKANKVSNPAAYFVHVIKSGLLHRFPAEQDETRAQAILKGCRRSGLIAHR